MMGTRSGVGLVERAVLEALDELSLAGEADPPRSSKVLAAVESRIGLAPGYSYEVLLDLGRWWAVPVRLVSVLGNAGGRGSDPAAGPGYTQARLSRAGEVVLAAERAELAPVPVGLINGSTYRGGSRPPFNPARVIGAIRQVLRQPDISVDEAAALVGPPDFMTGCTVSGDLAALAAGLPATLELRACVSVSDDRQEVIVSNLPPGANRDDVMISVAKRASQPGWGAGYPGLARAARLPVADVRDLSGRDAADHIVCVPLPGATAEDLAGQLLAVEGISMTVRVVLPQPLGVLIRDWAGRWPGEDLLAGLAALEKALQRG
jgi:hypothetical protein